MKHLRTLTVCAGMAAALAGGQHFALAQRVALKTNALYWAAGTPNLGAEFRMSRCWTLNLEGAFNKYDIWKINTRMAGFSPEVRYWFSTRPQTGHFVGLAALIGEYKLTCDGTCHHGNAYAFGPTYGYSLVLGKRWSMEATVGLGLAKIRERRYHTGETVPSTCNNVRWTPMPIKAGLSFVYLIR